MQGNGQGWWLAAVKISTAAGADIEWETVAAAVGERIGET